MVKPCSRCKRRHVGMVIIPNDGWLLLFATEWEENCTPEDLEFQARQQLPLVKRASNSMRVPWAMVI